MPFLKPGCFSLALAASVALPACATNPNIPIVRQISPAEVQPLSTDLPSRPLALGRVIMAIDRGMIIGVYRRGNLCIDPQPSVWGSGLREYRAGVYQAEFTRVLRQFGFRPREESGSLFEPPSSLPNDLIVGALILRVEESACYAVDIFHDNRGIYKGSVALSVRFEVFAPEDGKVVLTLDAEGSAIGGEFKPLWEHDYYAKAFGNALRVMLNDHEFRQLVFRQPGLGL
jgi:hypothetical protein